MLWQYYKTIVCTKYFYTVSVADPWHFGVHFPILAFGVFSGTYLILIFYTWKPEKYLFTFFAQRKEILGSAVHVLNT
jgi:hypothetical protein